MEGKIFLKTIDLKGFLSYSPTSKPVELQPLNILIGPNGSGKSNLIEAIEFIRVIPRDELSAPLRRSGGLTEWVWKGTENLYHFSIQIATADDDLDPFADVPLIYKLKAFLGTHASVMNESLQGPDGYYFNYKDTKPLVYEHKIVDGKSQILVASELSAKLSQTRSILSQIKDFSRYSEITSLGNNLQRIKVYRDWNLGRNTPPRLPQPADMPNEFLDEDAGNIGLVLNDLQNRPGTKQQILQRLQEFNPAVEDVTTKVFGGTIQIFLHEQGMAKAIPATRISDGTLHYLCLLSVLCHPKPPPLICIEEPETGLHPDMLPKVAELLIEASQRTQLIVTTHSDALVSALSSVPESVLVCERDDEGTHLRRLEPEKLKNWLEKYSLGELWRMGEIGGTL